jgi:potassium-transporting ATPase KdpC subunit
MKQIIKTSLIMLVIFTVITGILYPAAVWAAAKILFPFQAEGSLIKKNSEVTGSVLIAQDFKRPEYFHPRPSAVSFDAANSGGSNIAASSLDLAKAVFDRADREKKMNPLSTGLIPLEMITTSSSGLDPEITIKAAQWQAKRVSEARGMDEKTVLDAVYKLKNGALLGFIGPDRVNVLRLNLYLDVISAEK